MAYLDGIVFAVPADILSVAATLPTHLNELLRTSSGTASANVPLLSAAASAVVLLAASVAVARIVRRAGHARQQAMKSEVTGVAVGA